jgi:hypothetical protein
LAGSERDLRDQQRRVAKEGSTVERIRDQHVRDGPALERRVPIICLHHLFREVTILQGSARAEINDAEGFLNAAGDVQVNIGRRLINVGRSTHKKALQTQTRRLARNGEQRFGMTRIL